jgi:hypothetical protein
MGIMSSEPEALEPVADCDARAGAQAVECRASRPVVEERREGPRPA